MIIAFEDANILSVHKSGTRMCVIMSNVLLSFLLLFLFVVS